MDLNQVTISGKLTRDPELRYVGANKTPICSFGLAINKRWKDKRTGELKQEATFVDVDAWGKTGEYLAGGAAKGAGVLVVGELKLDRWEDKQSGQQRTKLKINAREIKLLAAGPRSEGAGKPAPAGVHREMNEGEDNFEGESIPF